jgi:ABC-type multidrug transport system fused ATPase/permease subunit
MLEISMNSVERICEYLKVEQEPKGSTLDVTLPDNVSHCVGLSDQANTHNKWPEHGAVQIDQLTIQYSPAHKPVLQDFSCYIQPGERVGIVGRTGAGKSTLAIALFRFIEATSGRILIDGIDISRLDLHDLRSRLTIIPQEPVLFSGTIRSNLDPLSEHTDYEIWDALRRSHLIEDDPSTERPAGLSSLDAPVYEGGANFSQGQRQLLAMARALLRRSKVSFANALLDKSFIPSFCS